MKKISNIIKNLKKNHGKECVQNNLDIVYKEILHGYKYGAFSDKDMAEHYRGLISIKKERK